LIYRHSQQNKKILRFVKIWIAPVVILLLIARILLMTSLLPERFGFYGKKERNKAIQTVAEQLPVVFTGSFQKPSVYSFFSKNDAFVLSEITTRQTQFDIWQKELDYHGKPVFICSPFEKAEIYEANGHVFYGYKTENFQSVNRLRIEYTLSEKEIHAGDTLDIQFKIYNPMVFDINFHHSEFPVTCKVAYKINTTVYIYNGELIEEIDILKSNESLYRTFKTIVPDLPADDYLFALILDNTVYASKNSDYVSIKISSGLKR